MVVELSYCADRCWVDVGEASPVREMALQPLLEASGVLAEQHAKAVADGADLFCLPVTPPDEPSAAAAAAAAPVCFLLWLLPPPLVPFSA